MAGDEGGPGSDVMMSVESGDASVMDVRPDTFVVPDGPVPDGACNGNAEDCQNGVDDNCNNLIDCADPVCQNAGYTCAAAPPNGWTGPVAFWEAMNMMPPACSGNYNSVSVDTNSGLSAQPAQCGCSCGFPQNQTCPSATGAVYDGNGSCAIPCSGNFNVPTNNGCVNFGCSPSSGFTSALVPKFAASGGTCSANGSSTVPPATWTNNARTCAYGVATEQGGCMANNVCVGAAPNSFAGPCVVQAGDLACPQSYPNKHLEYGGVSDSRGCTQCTCGLTPGTCTGSVIFYAGMNCGGNVTGVFALGGPCSTVTGGGLNPISAGTVNGGYTVQGGSCNSNGSSPQGSATPAMPSTICCK
jgi:hypothetical protein